jgi:hypothetical protein
VSSPATTIAGSRRRTSDLEVGEHVLLGAQEVHRPAFGGRDLQEPLHEVDPGHALRHADAVKARSPHDA